MDLKIAETTFETKLTLLRMTMNRTDAILQTGQLDAIERHQKALRTAVTETYYWRRPVEEQRIAAKPDVEEINVWSTDVEVRFSEADSELRRLG